MVAFNRGITSAFKGNGAFNNYTNTAVTSPQGVFTVSIANRWYGVDTSYEAFRRGAIGMQSLPAQRESINLTNISGEGTVNTEGLWRREQNDWSAGSGQLYLDRPESKANRFYKSKGINPWTKWQLSVLPDTKQQNGYSGTLVKAIAVKNYVYAVTTVGVYYTTNYTSWTEVTLSGGHLVSADITTNGATVWCANGSNIYSATVGTSTFGATPLPWSSALTPTNISTLSWQLDKLLVSWGNTLGWVHSFNYTGHATGYAIDLLWAHPDNNWVWSCFATCEGAAYVGGYSLTAGQKSNGNVYYTQYEPATTAGTLEAMSIPISALPLSGGEYPTALFGYLNFLFIGSNLGVRMSSPTANSLANSSNFLTAGPLLPSINEPVAQPVTGITGHGRFVYFAWNNYDGVSSGIGRMDLTTFIDTLAPAYASDLMVTVSTTTSILLDWCPITNGPLLSMDGSGLWTQASTYVPYGTIQSGQITYGIAEDKVATFIHYGAIQSVTEVAASISVNGSSTFTPLLPMFPPQQSGDYQIKPALQGEYFNLQLTITGTTPSTQLSRWTLRAYPALSAETEITQELQLFDVVNVNGIDYTYDPYAEFLFFDNLRRSQTVVRYVEGPLQADVLIYSLRWIPYERRDNYQGGFRGNLEVVMRTVNGFVYDPRPTY